MTGKKTFAVWAGAAASLLAVTLIIRFVSANPIVIRGAVFTSDPDPAKELPIADVLITVTGGPALPAVRSDASGYFNIPLRRRIPLGLPVILHFQQKDYQPLELRDVTGNQLYIARMIPLTRPTPPAGSAPQMKISHIVVRYSTATTTEVNVGSAVKTFQVVNIGNVPCKGQRPCSPDGKWKAAIGSMVLDAGSGNQFRNARASCIAGPCPFTRIEDSDSAPDGREFRVSAMDWSDTATFLVEAEVYRQVVNDVLLQSYPLIFEQALTFTLPAAAQEISIQADMNGTTIVFPLGPALHLNWADCQRFVNTDRTRVYRCELKPGYRFS